jgi:glycosyltransferase involved in cell wall biosynthesis
MAFTPYFILSPNTLMSIAGYIHGPDKTVPTPAENWRDASVDVVIPALNEEQNIAPCLASIIRQTIRPKRIILIDDGSSDNTTNYAKTFSELNGIELIIIQRKSPIGKTPTIKRQSREFDADVEFILDADTILESDRYIERTVQELYQAVGIASACGTILPLRDKDREVMARTPSMEKFLGAVKEASVKPPNFITRMQRAVSNLYRDVLYMFLQRFIYKGQMVFFGTMTNPVGCAVAYRQKYVKELFDRYEPILGDDLTNSEDIFIGFALLNKGYRNIQLTDVYARSEEPQANRLPQQIYMWSSSFLQSCYYFDTLLLSPFKSLKRWRKRRRDKKSKVEERRVIQEPYRQSFGEEVTKTYGRPIGWVLLTSAMEKIFFPATLLIMIILKLWIPLGLTVLIETLVSLTILALISKPHRMKYLLKGVIATPIRYSSLLYDFITMLRFAADLWIFRSRRWRK